MMKPAFLGFHKLDSLALGLVVLNERCLKNKIPSSVEFIKIKGRSYIRRRTHLHLSEVFGMPMARVCLFSKTAYILYLFALV